METAPRHPSPDHEQIHAVAYAGPGGHGGLRFGEVDRGRGPRRSARLGSEEGDILHPAENVAKMTAGQPLTDEDRWPWLDTVASWIFEQCSPDGPE